MKMLAVGLVTFALVIGCRGTRPLSLVRESNTGNAFLTTGFYFGQFKKDASSYTQVLVFYRDGVLLMLESDRRNSVIAWKDYFTDDRYRNSHKAAPYWWGIYVVNAKSFRIEKWTSTDYAYPVMQLDGKALNDTTLLLKRRLSKRKGGGKFSYSSKTPTERFDTLRFVRLETKPDSSNKWIR